MSRFALSRGLSGRLRSLGCAAVVAALAGCATSEPSTQAPPPPAPVASAPLGETIGTGAVRVALILPRTAAGNGAATATAFRNAAELAIRDFPNGGIQIAIYDDLGSPAGAQAAIGAALKEGAQIVLGPVFSPSVAAVAPQARQAGVPVVAFSSDANVAGPGVYLLSFLPADDVARIVAYSASQNRKSLAALLPAGAYGDVVEAAFRRAVAAAGGRIVAIERYTAADLTAKTAAIARIAAQIDALLMPDSGEVVPTIAAALQAAGVTRDRVKFLGSGQWDDPRILNDPALVGSWFPAPPKQGFEEFSRKYQAAYGAAPPRNATLAYDATVLAAGLVLRYGPEAFGSDIIASPNGFNGMDGVFRFTPQGLTERRLAVYEVTGSGARIVAPAARSFAAGS